MLASLAYCLILLTISPTLLVGSFPVLRSLMALLHESLELWTDFQASLLVQESPNVSV